LIDAFRGDGTHSPKKVPWAQLDRVGDVDGGGNRTTEGEEEEEEKEGDGVDESKRSISSSATNVASFVAHGRVAERTEYMNTDSAAVAMASAIAVARGTLGVGWRIRIAEV
jgi:hypothetical protein